MSRSSAPHCATGRTRRRGYFLGTHDARPRTASHLRPTHRAISIPPAFPAKLSFTGAGVPRRHPGMAPAAPLPPSLELHSHRELSGSRIVHPRHLSEGRRRVRGVCAGTEIPVQGDDITAIREVEHLDQTFHPHTLPDSEGTAQTNT